MSLAYLFELKRLPFCQTLCISADKYPTVGAVFLFWDVLQTISFFYYFEPLNTFFYEHTITHAVHLDYVHYVHYVYDRQIVQDSILNTQNTRFMQAVNVGTHCDMNFCLTLTLQCVAFHSPPCSFTIRFTMFVKTSVFELRSEFK